MSFSQQLNKLNIDEIKHSIYSATDKDVENALSASKVTAENLAALLSPAARKYLEPMASMARALTISRFGKTIKIYAPLYLSNDCVNSCLYCGFNRTTYIPRITLTPDEIRREAEILSSMGIKNVILVSGDNRAAFSDEMIKDAVKICAQYFPMISVEVRTLPTETYAELRECGADGLTVFQETYIKDSYAFLHPKGPKSNFEYRLDAPERAAAAGIRAIGMGALLGLEDFRTDVYIMCLHAKYIADKYYRSHVSASFPRIRASAGCFTPKNIVTDANIVQAIGAFRLFLPDCGINISTREPASFRDRLIHLGATIMSAGSKTEPGGYANAKEDAGQFHIEDSRSVEEFTEAVKRSGYDPVMKDWDSGFRDTVI